MQTVQQVKRVKCSALFLPWPRALVHPPSRAKIKEETGISHRKNIESNTVIMAPFASSASRLTSKLPKPPLGIPQAEGRGERDGEKRA